MDAPIYLPTPAEIRAACRKIQEGWSRREARRRELGRVPPAEHVALRGCQPLKPPARRHDPIRFYRYAPTLPPEFYYEHSWPYEGIEESPPQLPNSRR